VAVNRTNRPVEQTLDETSVHMSADISAHGAKPRVELVEGSTAELSVEMMQLLRSRLRIAAIVLAICFLSFFVRNYFEVDFSRPHKVIMFALNGLVGLVLGAIGAGLCRRCELHRAKLLVSEAIIFGLPALYFLMSSVLTLHLLHTESGPGPAATQERSVSVLALQQPHTQQGSFSNPALTDPSDNSAETLHERLSHVENPALPWVMLTYVYSMFIPNPWRRAAWIIAIFATLPVLTLTIAVLVSPPVSGMISVAEVTTVALVMALAALMSIWGVYTLNQLRSREFEARQLGQYHLTHLIGAGGMGEVYLAEHQMMKRPCAIKVIRPSKAADPQALARFEREVRAMSRLSHWNTVEIFDYGRTSDGTFYYVMEYLPGLSIAELVARHGPLPPERAVYLLEQTCDALGEAHSLGLIHRDIKPGNIFAAQRGGHFDVAKLLDFGLAKRANSTQDSLDLTQEGSVTGSPLYMSPEQATGKSDPDARSDIYALGSVAYYMLTGRPPFPGNNPIQVMVAHASQAVVPPSSIRPDVPMELEQIIMRCLAKDPKERYQTTAELSAALAESGFSGRWSKEMAKDWWAGQESNHPIPTEGAANSPQLV